MNCSQNDFRSTHVPARFLCTLILAVLFWQANDRASAGPPAGTPSAGYRFLTEKPYLPPDFDDAVFEELWRVWPEPLRTQAERSTETERRRLTFARYGLTPRPDDTSGKPLQYVVKDGQWSMNCFACHGGMVDGETYPGAPNTQYALELLTADVRSTKLRMSKPMGHMDVGSLFMPLGKTRGTTNAVMFGVALLAYRDQDLQILPKKLPPRMVHHDMDAPPWWHFHRKKNLYIDGFAPKGHRPLMQFMLVEQNGPEDFNRWQHDFKDVFAYISSLRPPTYHGPVDRPLAAKGQRVFQANCAECHGTYGPNSHYPERMIPIDDIGTDRVRWQALSTRHRQRYAESWFHQGTEEVQIAPEGYVAPPLDGVWASAPYLHNGSIPTLWHLLHPEARPRVWKRKETQDGFGMDRKRMGLSVVELDEIPPAARLDGARRIEYFDTQQFGKSSAGHDYPDALSEDEKRAVLEYLKTL